MSVSAAPGATGGDGVYLHLITNRREAMHDDDLNHLLDNWRVLTGAECRWRAQRIIECFDARFDIPQRRDEALGALTILLREVTVPGREEPAPPTAPKKDPAATDPLAFEALTLRVGEAWCRLVDADMTYDLLAGLEAKADSQALAERLAAILAAGDADAPSRAAARYALARWFDGAGRINHRCGDLMGAADDFGRACAFAAGMPWCLGDMRSNLARARFDADVQVGRSLDLELHRRTFEAHLATAEADAAERARRSLPALRGKDDEAVLAALRAEGDADVAAWWGLEPRSDAFPASPLFEGLDTQAREAIRGLCNLEHNFSVVHKKFGEAHRALSRQRSERSARYAWVNADRYRFAQALRHLADITPRPDALCKVLSVRVRGLRWPRGRWMAAQYLAEHLNKKQPPEPEEARKLLREALDEIETQQRRRGSDLGLDVDVWQYTVKQYREAGGPDAEARELRAARSLRRAVKAPLYRKSFKDNVLPLYNAAVARRAAELAAPSPSQERIEELLALLEETAARELLDLLSSDGTAAGSAPLEQGAAGEDGDPFPDPQGADPPRTRGTTASGASAGMRTARRAQDEGTESLHAQLAADRADLEQREFQQRTNGGEADAEVAAAMRRLSARDDGPTILRYFAYTVGKDDRRFAVVVARGGALSRAIELPGGVDALVGRNAQGTTPSEDYARELWQTFFERAWEEITRRRPSGVVDGAARDAQRDPRPPRLVVIPAPGMFALPLHVALMPKEHAAATGYDREVPLCVACPLAFSVSATSYITRRRYLLQRQPFDATDDLCALVPTYGGGRDINPAELVGTGWPADRFHLAGRAPTGHTRPAGAKAGTVDGLAEVLRHRAEVFVFAGHGVTVPVDGRKDVEVALELDAPAGADAARRHSLLTQYRLLGGDLRLHHNKWALLNACVSGGGSDDVARAEVTGFIKSFIAAGAGALTVTLWPVHDDDIARVSGRLLREAASAARSGGTVDIVDRVHAIQREAYDEACGMEAPPGGAPSEGEPDGADAAPRGGVRAFGSEMSVPFHACPVVVYL